MSLHAVRDLEVEDVLRVGEERGLAGERSIWAFVAPWSKDDAMGRVVCVATEAGFILGVAVARSGRVEVVTSGAYVAAGWQPMGRVTSAMHRLAGMADAPLLTSLADRLELAAPEEDGAVDDAFWASRLGGQPRSLGGNEDEALSALQRTHLVLGGDLGDLLRRWADAMVGGGGRYG